LNSPLDPMPHFGPPEKRRLSAMAEGLVGSEILKIAADVRQALAAGEPVCNLTVGDFSPRQFRIPASFEADIVRAYAEGETNYPPSDGVGVLREAVAGFYARRLGLAYPPACILVAGGGRPLIYGAYRTLVDEGDRVVYPVPSWNNNHYVHLTGAAGVPVVCGAETEFLPTAAQLEPHLPGARLVALCSPLNPAGTLFDPDALGAICDAILAENARRGPGERPLYLLYDQIYWMLTYGTARHATPPGLRPAMARYTVFVDGVSKAFAATGERVGWAAGPPDVIERMSGLLGHVGAWAPRPEQVAAARLLADDAAIDAYHGTMKPAVEERLTALHAGLVALAEAGLPVRTIPPRAAIYLTAQFDLIGARTPAGDILACGDDIRRYLLAEAGLAMVPFSAFGAADDSGWCRLSVGAVSGEDIAAVLPRLEAALRALPVRGAPVGAGKNLAP
jgi:aspartate aminotransferase